MKTVQANVKLRWASRSTERRSHDEGNHKKRHYKVGADKARFKVPGGPGPGLPPTEGFIGADSTGATGNFAPVLTQEPQQTLRFAPVPFMAVLLFFK